MMSGNVALILVFFKNVFHELQLFSPNSPKKTASATFSGKSKIPFRILKAN